MAIHHLVARGVEMANQARPTTSGENTPWDDLMNDPKAKIGLAALSVTVVTYMLVHMTINYIYGLLIPNLVMTEAPAQTTVIKTTEYRDDETESPDAPLLTKEEKEVAQPRDEEVLIIVHKPLTAKFRTILSHLKHKTGTRKSAYRGVGGYIIFNILASAVAGLSRKMFWRMYLVPQVFLMASLCLFSTAWVQQTVAMPGKSYFQRVSQLRRAGAFKKLFLPVLFVEAVEVAVFSLPRNLMIITHSSSNMDAGVAVSGAVVTLVGLFGFACVVVPLNIGLVRFQASLLPEEEETIIPIDRTLGNAEVKGIRAGWKSFSRDGLLRLVKTWVKLIFMQLFVSVVLAGFAIFQMKFFLGEHFDKPLERARGELRH